MAKESEAHFPLTLDVRGAHRLATVNEKDLGYQACVVGDRLPRDPEDEVWLNLVVTFGVASAACWRSRLGAAGVRALHYVLGPRYAMWSCSTPTTRALRASVGACSGHCSWGS